jgi:hypothetical protein
MGPAISDILPLALGVMISPVPIIAVILMLFSAKARSNGPAFLAGWVIGLSVASAIVYALSDGVDVSSDSDASDAASIVKMVLGAGLVVLAWGQWRKRPAPGSTAEMPKWMQAIDSFTPLKSAGFGVALSAVNPKNLLLIVGAALSIGQAGLSTSDAIVVIAVFVTVGSLSIAGPVGVYLLAGEKAQTILDGWKAWLQDNNAAVMAALLLVFGVVVFSKGLGPITA